MSPPPGEPEPPAVFLFQTDFPSQPTSGTLPFVDFDLNAHPGAMRYEGGLPRLDWEVVEAALEHQPVTARRAAARQWMEAMADALGPPYLLAEAGDLLLVTAQPEREARRLAEWTAAAARRIESMALPRNLRGRRLWPRAVIDFDDPGRYYDYVSAGDSDGEFIDSAAIHMREGYPHVAINRQPGWHRSTSILHEFVHDTLFGLDSPIWLEEGVAQYLPQIILQAHTFTLDREMAQRHQRLWRRVGLQSFWSGRAFGIPDERSELSYHLAELLVRNLTADFPRKFRAFLAEAKAADAGDAAARRRLGRPLEHIARQFLGDGEWAPAPEDWVLMDLVE